MARLLLDDWGTVTPTFSPEWSRRVLLGDPGMPLFFDPWWEGSLAEWRAVATAYLNRIEGP